MTSPLGMMMEAPAPNESSFWRWWRAGVNSIAIAAVAAVGGAALVWIALWFGDAAPWMMVALPALPLVVLAIALDHRLGPWLVFLTFPVSTFVSSIGGLPLQPVEAAVLFVTVVIALTRVARGAVPIDAHPALIGAFFLFTWTVVALPSAPVRTLAVNQTLSLLAGLVFAMLVIAICADVASLRVVVGGLVAVAGGAALWALATGGPPEAVHGGATVADRLAGPFNQPNQLGAFSALTGILAAGLSLGAKSRWARLAAGAAAVALFGALALSLSRGAWIGAAAGLVVFFLGSPLVRPLIVVPLVIVAAGAALFLGGSDNVQVEVVGARLESFTERGPYDSRPEIWAEARRQMQDDPVTGQGPGNFPVVSGRSASRASNVYPDHAHNLFLNWAAEVGLPGALAIVVLIVSLGVTARRARRRAIALGRMRDASLIAGCAGALTSVVFHGLLDYPLRNQVLWIALWAVIGMLLAAARAIPFNSWPSGSDRRRRSSRASTPSYAAGA